MQTTAPSRGCTGRSQDYKLGQMVQSHAGHSAMVATVLTIRGDTPSLCLSLWGLFWGPWLPCSLVLLHKALLAWVWALWVLQPSIGSCPHLRGLGFPPEASQTGATQGCTRPRPRDPSRSHSVLCSPRASSRAGHGHRSKARLSRLAPHIHLGLFSHSHPLSTSPQRGRACWVLKVRPYDTTGEGRNGIDHGGPAKETFSYKGDILGHPEDVMPP